MEDVNVAVVIVVIIALAAIAAMVLGRRFVGRFGNTSFMTEPQKKEVTVAKGLDAENAEIDSITAVLGDDSYTSVSTAENAKLRNSRVRKMVGVDMSKNKK